MTRKVNLIKEAGAACTAPKNFMRGKGWTYGKGIYRAKTGRYHSTSPWKALVDVKTYHKAKGVEKKMRRVQI